LEIYVHAQVFSEKGMTPCHFATWLANKENDFLYSKRSLIPLWYQQNQVLVKPNLSWTNFLIKIFISKILGYGSPCNFFLFFSFWHPRSTMWVVSNSFAYFNFLISTTCSFYTLFFIDVIPWKWLYCTIPFKIWWCSRNLENFLCGVAQKTLHDLDNSHINFFAKCIEKKGPNCYLTMEWKPKSLVFS
jgi:hypothetical protein